MDIETLQIGCGYDGHEATQAVTPIQCTSLALVLPYVTSKRRYALCCPAGILPLMGLATAAQEITREDVLPLAAYRVYKRGRAGKSVTQVPLCGLGNLSTYCANPHE